MGHLLTRGHSKNIDKGLNILLFTHNDILNRNNVSESQLEVCCNPSMILYDYDKNSCSVKFRMIIIRVCKQCFLASK